MAQTKLHICVTCRKIGSDKEQEIRDGARLLDAVKSELAGETGIEVLPVECLSSCDLGCNIALSETGKWSYVYGKLDPETDAKDIASGVRAYATTNDGLVPWRERPTIFRKQSIARIPPQES